MKKSLHHHFVHHLRSYRTFYFMFFTFVLSITSIFLHIFGNKIYADDLLEKAFEPALQHETIVNLWAGKNAVGNEVFEWSATITLNNRGCFVENEKISTTDLQTQKAELWYEWADTDEDNRAFCETVLGGDYRVDVVTTEAPLIIRITKLLLRITMVLAVSMVIFNGIMRIIESSKWEAKDSKQNMILIIVGILIALFSLSIINLISSISISSLGKDTTVLWCIVDDTLLPTTTLDIYICENTLWYTRDSSKNKCYVDNTSESQCNDLWWERGNQLSDASNNCYISLEKYVCERKLFRWRDVKRNWSNKCYILGDTTKSECDEVWWKRGSQLSEFSNRCYTPIQTDEKCVWIWWILQQ